MIIVFVYAHPDDAEFLAGGSLAKWVEDGHDVYAICATNGDLGTRNRLIKSQDLANMRKNELEEAMNVFGAKKPIFLNFPDGLIQKHPDELKEHLVYWFRKLKPYRIVTLDPWKKYEPHPDHVSIGKIASEAAVFSCFPLLYPDHLKEGLDPHQPKEIWFMTPMEHKPNRLVDISKTFNKKIEAILCHKSQVEMLADLFVEGADPTRLNNEIKQKLRVGLESLLNTVAQAQGSLSNGKIEMAEAFYALKVGAGHFNNEQEFIKEMIGFPPEEPEIH